MEITFVRHGQTEWNSLGKQQGKEDIPLNSRGIEQAKQTAQLLADRQFDRVYCSPLQRAKQTAQIICENRQIPIFYEPRIAERDMGEFQGKRWDEFDTRAFGIMQQTTTISRQRISAIFMTVSTTFWMS